MIEFRQKEFGVLGTGLANIASGAGSALGGIAKGAAVAGGGILKGVVPTLTGAGQVAASGLAAGSLGLKAGALWGAAHPLILGGLGAYALYKILKRRRERKMQERGYSVVEKMYAKVPASVVKERMKDIKGIKFERIKNTHLIPKANPKPMRLQRREFSEEYIDPNEPYVPKGPREAVPKKIVKKAKKSGVVQKDSNGNWRIINMHGPEGHPVFWKPCYKSKESASAALNSWSAGKWRKK